MVTRRKFYQYAFYAFLIIWGCFVALSASLPEPRAATSDAFHPLGLTPLGADLAATLLLAAGRAHAFAAVAVAVALGIALPLGMLAGIRPGQLTTAIETWLGRLLDSVGAFVLVAAVLAMFPGLSIFRIAMLLGLILWTSFTGIVRHAVIEVRRQAYYEAAIACGLPLSHLMYHYFIPAIWRRTAPQALGVAALLVGALGAVDFMGLGVKREVSVGYLLYDSLAQLISSPRYFLAALVTNVVVVASLAVVKDVLTRQVLAAK